MDEITREIIRSLSNEIHNIQKYVDDNPKKDEAIKRIMEGIFWLKDIC